MQSAWCKRGGGWVEPSDFPTPPPLRHALSSVTGVSGGGWPPPLKPYHFEKSPFRKKLDSQNLARKSIIQWLALKPPRRRHGRHGEACRVEAWLVGGQQQQAAGGEATETRFRIQNHGSDHHSYYYYYYYYYY